MPGPLVRRGERVTLRTAEREDRPFLQRACANPRLRHAVGNPVMDREGFAESREDDDADRFVVCLDDEAGPGAPDDDPRRVGGASVTDTSYKRPELGYWLVPEVHGDGHGGELLSLLVEYAFRQYDAPAVGAAAYDFNDASRGVLESVGLEEEGRRRKFMFVDGEHRDLCQYGLLREEWRDRS
jgi:RimJ/RimL family protein N-acetyltransferase